MNIGAFKVWYTIMEAAQVAAEKLGEPITDSDILDKINYQELRGWLDCTGRYARRAYPASRFEPGTPLHREVDCIFVGDETIDGMMGYYELYTGPRSSSVRFDPIDERTAKATWTAGTLLLDHDGGSVLQIVRRHPGAPIDSRDPLDFRLDDETIPHDKLWIAADDLRALLEGGSDRHAPDANLNATEKTALYKLLAAMAIKGYEYEPGAKKQKKGVISGIKEHLKSLGVSMDDATIGKHLKAATAQFAKPANSIESMARQMTIQK
jgi:hypothetical protein